MSSYGLCWRRDPLDVRRELNKLQHPAALVPEGCQMLLHVTCLEWIADAPELEMERCSCEGCKARQQMPLVLHLSNLSPPLILRISA